MTAPSAISPHLSPEEIRRETALGLAGDLLDHALRMLPADLHISLIQIADSGLLIADPGLEKQTRELSYALEKTLDQLRRNFPECDHGGAHGLLRREGATLARVVDLYRQEQFGTRRDRESLIASELLIADLYRLYSRVELLRRQIDAENSDGLAENRSSAPKREPNPYESIY